MASDTKYSTHTTAQCSYRPTIPDTKYIVNIVAQKVYIVQVTKIVPT